MQTLFRKEDLRELAEHPLMSLEKPGVNPLDAVVPMKLFCPWNRLTWFILEADVASGLVFLYAVGPHSGCSEYGHMYMRDFEKIRRNGSSFFLPGVERDEFFRPMPFREALKRGGFLEELALLEEAHAGRSE